MLKSYQIYACRRVALDLTPEELAEKVGVDKKFVIDMEKGNKIPFAVYERIKTTIRNEFNNLDQLEHYKRRILEIAIEMILEEDNETALQNIAHIMIEAAKMQNELIGVQPKRKEDWK